MPDGMSTTTHTLQIDIRMACPWFCLAVFHVLNCPGCHLNDFNAYMHVYCYDWAQHGVSDRTCDGSHDQETIGIVIVTK